MTLSKRRLAITLFKEHVHSFEECLSGKDIENQHNIKTQFGVEGNIYIGAPTEEQVEWHGFLSEGTDDTIKPLINRSNRAAIILKIDRRFLGISFGYGQALLNKKKTERNFGLKVVINSVDPSNLRSFDSAKLDDNTILTRKQSSRGGTRAVFGADIPSELLCGVSGKCTEPILGSAVAGKDQLLISPKINFTNLFEVVKTALVQYGKTTYKNHFPWYDNIQIEQDPDTCATLEENLTNALKAKEHDLFSLACPEIYDPSEVNGFSFTAKGEPNSDLDFNEYFAYLEKIPTAEVSAEYLKNHKIWVKDVQGEDIDKWRAFDCLNFETELSNKKYILFKGEWYRVASDYHEELKKYFQDHLCFTFDVSDPCLLSLPKFPNTKGHREGEYCVNTADRKEDLISLDQKNIKISKTISVVEPCDLLSKDGKFIHIKKKYSSAALSHLFAQGRVSAELLKTEPKFRKKLRKKIRDEGKFDQEIIPLNKIDPGRYKIIFAIIDEKLGDLKLPFFSMVNFQATGKYLEALGYEVFITKIHYAES